MKIGKLFLWMCFVSGSLQTIAMDSNTHALFVRHVTNVLPVPMKIGGLKDRCTPAPFPYRCTLHWSVLGLEPTAELRSITGGGSTGAAPEIIEHTGKYIILEKFNHIAPFIVGGWPFDIYIVGPYSPSHESILFMPASECTTDTVKDYSGEVICYDEDSESSKEALKAFLAQHSEIRTVQKCRAAMKVNALERYPNIKLCTIAHNNLASFMAAKYEEKIHYYTGDCSVQKTQRYGNESLCFRWWMFNISANESDFILFGFTDQLSGAEDNKIMLRNLCCQQNIRDFDALLFINNETEPLSFNSLLEAQGFSPLNLYFDHNSSDFFTLETLSGKLRQLSDKNKSKDYEQTQQELLALLAKINLNIERADAKANFHEFARCAAAFWDS